MTLRSVCLFLLVSIMGASCASRKIASEYLTEKYTDPTSSFLTVEGVRIHYREKGQGPALVLLHGIASSLHTWDEWTTLLSDEFRVIRPDLPGFGLTGPDPHHNYSMDRYKGVLQAFLRELGVDRCYLVGNSLGGWIAWEFTLDYPGTVEKLVLIDAAGFITPDDPPKPLRLAQQPMFRKMVSKGAPRFLVRKFLKQAYGDRKKVSKELVDRYFELNNRPGNPEAFLSIANSKYQSRSSRLIEIQVPTLILWGEEDKKWIDVSHAYMFQELLPNDQLILYPGVGHLPMEELPGQSSQDVRRFLLD